MGCTDEAGVSADLLEAGLLFSAKESLTGGSGVQEEWMYSGKSDFS
jgi:hypothetical protein